MALRPAIFLDRDGTLNAPIIQAGKPYPPQKLEDFKLLDGVAAACRDLKKAGFLLAVVTNQPDVGRGTQSQAVVEEMHATLKQLLPEIDHIEVCYDSGHGEKNRRRKPEPGMLEDTTALFGIDINTSWMIGDRWRDIECGKKMGVKTIFIDYGYQEQLTEQPDFRVPTFSAAAVTILKNHPVL
jgi:D-glycero-D-manno-heptose 1,7-bisphosphate phosphatase